MDDCQARVRLIRPITLSSLPMATLLSSIIPKVITRPHKHNKFKFLYGSYKPETVQVEKKLRLNNYL